jgi:hypothetical protein
VVWLSGATILPQKTLDFPQNVENKEPEFYLPCRSMVLKVVRGTIFKTLELYGPSWHLSFAFAVAGPAVVPSRSYSRRDCTLMYHVSKLNFLKDPGLETVI